MMRRKVNGVTIITSNSPIVLECANLSPRLSKLTPRHYVSKPGSYKLVLSN